MTTYEGVPEVCREAYDDAFARIAAAMERGNKLLICGNGGSCADAEHIVGELMKGFLKQRPSSSRMGADTAPMVGPLGLCLYVIFMSETPFGGFFYYIK